MNITSSVTNTFLSTSLGPTQSPLNSTLNVSDADLWTSSSTYGYSSDSWDNTTDSWDNTTNYSTLSPWTPSESNTSWNATPTTIEDDPYAESDALFYFRRIVPAILLLIGVPGNFISMAVMCRKTFRSNSTGLYLFVLLVADTVFLFSNYSFIFWLINTFKTFELVHSRISCKLWVYFSDCGGFIGSWVLVTLTIERAIVVVAPHRTSVVFSRKKAGIVVSAIVIIMMVINLYIPVTFDSIRNRNTNPIRPMRSCFFAAPYSGYLWIVVLHYIGPFLIYSFFPACCIIVSNIIIIYKMRRRPELTAVKNAMTRARESETQKVTYLLMAASAFFLLSTFPMTTLLFLENVLKFLRMWNLTLNEVYRYVMVLMPLNQAFNFLVYCISGASFRKELNAMFQDCSKLWSCKCRRRRKGVLVLPRIMGGDGGKMRPISIDTRSGSSVKTQSTYL